MNKYELLYIIDNDLSEDEKQAVIDRLSAVVTTAGGEVIALDKWGERKYAYDIKFKSAGYYVLMNFQAAESVPAELERQLRNADAIVRFMIIRK